MLAHYVTRVTGRDGPDVAAGPPGGWRFAARGLRVAVSPRSAMLRATLDDGTVVTGRNRPGHGGRGVYLFGDRVEPELPLVRALLEPGQCLVDVGSCVGAYALVAARRLGPGGTVVAIDPNPEAMAVLAANETLNGLANIVKVCAAAADRPGFRPFGGSPRPDARGLLAGAHRPGADEPGALVQTVTIDEVLAALALAAPVRAIKIDAEGAEAEVVSGARATIAAWRPVIVAETAVHPVPPPDGYLVYRRAGSRNEVWLHTADDQARRAAEQAGFATG